MASRTLATAVAPVEVVEDGGDVDRRYEEAVVARNKKREALKAAILRERRAMGLVKMGGPYGNIPQNPDPQHFELQKVSLPPAAKAAGIPGGYVLVHKGSGEMVVHASELMPAATPEQGPTAPDVPVSQQPQQQLPQETPQQPAIRVATAALESLPRAVAEEPEEAAQREEAQQQVTSNENTEDSPWWKRVVQRGLTLHTFYVFLVVVFVLLAILIVLMLR